MKKYIAVILIVIFFVCQVSYAQYTGQTFAIDLSRGGLNYNQNTDQMSATAMVDGSRNINLHQGGRSKRGGTDNVNTTAISGTPRIYGLYQFRLQDGNTFILTATSDGKIQKDYGTELKTGLTIDRAVHFVTFNNLVIITTGNGIPQVWDGSAGSTSDLSNVPTDWTNGNYPRKMIKHGRGASERLWAIYGKTDPFTVYASDLSAGDGSTEPDFSDANVITIYIDTGDGFGIINAVEFGDRLLCSGKNQVFLIDDLSTTVAEWGYEVAQWRGGTANDRTFIVVENDVLSFTEAGDIYSVVTQQDYGDYAKSSFTRPAFIDEWIRANIRLLSIDDFHTVYDPVLRCVYFFFVRQGQTDIDTALCYFVDRGPEEGWIVKDNLNSDSGYKASCSALVRKAVGSHKIYTGGWSDGYIWELETTAQSDNGNAYSSGFKTAISNFGAPRDTKRFDVGWIVTNAKGNYNLLIDIWVDGVYIKQETVSLAGIGSTYGSGIYGADANAGIYATDEKIEASFDIGVVGKRIQYHLFNNNVNEDFFTTSLMTDFVSLGRIVR